MNNTKEQTIAQSLDVLTNPNCFKFTHSNWDHLDVYYKTPKLHVYAMVSDFFFVTENIGNKTSKLTFTRENNLPFSQSCCFTATNI